MWRPDVVIPGHKRRGIALWIFMILGIIAYTTWIILQALWKSQDPDTSLVLSNEVYLYPDILVCLFDSYGCDKYDREQKCANSTTTIEGMLPTMVFYPNTTTDAEGNTVPIDDRLQEIVGEYDYKEGRGHCVRFETSKVETFLGEEREPANYFDYFLLDMYWYPGGIANASTTCVPDGERWTSHKEWVYVFFQDRSTNETSSAMQISYSCITSASDSHIFTTLGMGLTKEENLKANDTSSYKSLSTSPSIFKDAVNESIFTPYAYLAMEIQQEPNSLQTITEIDPFDVAEMLGNIGGFWDLILILWPIFFVAVTRESPTQKPRNLRKSVTRAAERAKRVTPTISIPRPLKRTMCMDGMSGRSVHGSDQPKEVPYWDSASSHQRPDLDRPSDV